MTSGPAFRCSTASRELAEPQEGTASTVRSFLLVEAAGPWGVDAVRDSRLPAPVKAALTRLEHNNRVRPLLIRRPGRASGDPRVRVFAGYVHAAEPWLQTTLLDAAEELLELDLDGLADGRSPGLEPHADPVFLVCTHGRHDACCAELGRLIARELAAGPHADRVWEVSHIGGDRFAGNLLVLPRGLYYGGLDAASGHAVADVTARGEVLLEHLRGRSDLPMAVQYADVEVRRRLGLRGLDDVRPLSVRTTDGVTTVVLDAAGTPVELSVRQVLGAEERLTCRAGRTSAVPRFEVVAA